MYYFITYNIYLILSQYAISLLKHWCMFVHNYKVWSPTVQLPSTLVR